MTKAFSILHRAAALLVALCLLVGMALPVYAAEDGALFFNAGSETIPTIPAANTSSEGVEPAQEPIVSDLETIPGEGDTPPTANEPGTEAGNTVNNTAAVPNNDGKTQEAAENQTPAADTDTAPADPALTDKTPADTPDTAAAPNHACSNACFLSSVRLSSFSIGTSFSISFVAANRSGSPDCFASGSIICTTACMQR